MAQEKVFHPRSWLECNVLLALLTIHAVDSGVQTEEIAHDYEEKNNHRVMNELKVFRQHLLDYNKRTFEKFMQDIESKYREQVTANKKLQCEIEDLKMQLLEAERELASMKPHPRQRRTPEEYKAELEDDNINLRDALKSEIEINHQNEKRIKELEREYTQCKQEIQNFNKEIECLENTSEEEIAELRSEIFRLKNQLNQARKDV
ncbi:20554_t:CDS:2 [Cetraspora pellucida]|uniref:20554_t:CDS:1 n=1 Tax=Cetraspora pellucida TaxID=1433469 RepID=A0A9N9DS44_9GLOM|nr:20554_t:CDS:2 [Cetraspora pellucida]